MEGTEEAVLGENKNRCSPSHTFPPVETISFKTESRGLLYFQHLVRNSLFSDFLSELPFHQVLPPLSPSLIPNPLCPQNLYPLENLLLSFLLHLFWSTVTEYSLMVSVQAGR